MTDAQKAERFSEVLDHVTSLLTTCVSKECTLADQLHAEYPDMITLEWGRDLPQPIHDLAVTELGISGTLTCGCVFVPWHAIINVRSTYGTYYVKWRPPARPPLRLIRGGKA